MEAKKLNNLIANLAKYGVDKIDVILDKIDKLMDKAGLSFEDACEALEEYYKEKTNNLS